MSIDNSPLATKRTPPALNYAKWLGQAAKAGKGLGSLIWELGSLMFGRGKLQPHEYFMYRLYDDNLYTPEIKRTFLGIQGPTLPSPWPEIVNDKPTLTALLQGLGFPVPETQAMVHPSRSFGEAHTLRGREDVQQFLREHARYPLFGKPFDSACSLGTAHITQYHPAEDCLELAGSKRISFDDFFSMIEKLGTQYLFQTVLKPHPKLVPLTGPRLSTVRMFVLSDEDGCEFLRASWKISVGDNGADNFWRVGNVLAGIDAETGRIVKAFRRTPEGTEAITAHPVSEISFEDYVFPEWDAMKDVVLRAAANLPGCYFQGWDVALTDRGPVLIELEGDGGDPIMEQLCFESGLLQGRYKRILDNAKQIEKAKQNKAKARRNAILKESFGQLKNPRPVMENPATDEIQPEEVRAALQPNGEGASTECSQDAEPIHSGS